MRIIANSGIVLLMIWALSVSALAFLDITIHFPWVMSGSDGDLLSPSSNKNWRDAYLFVLWPITPHWEKPSILSLTFSLLTSFKCFYQR